MTGFLRLMNAALHAYEIEIAAARQRLEDRPELRALVAVESDPALLHAFLIQWASRSIQLHEPAEQFLVETSRRCAELGEPKLALTLLHIANDAIELYRMLADDTRSLAHLWNQRRLPHLDMTSLLTQVATPGIRACHAHHERLIAGPEPWAELAATFEVQAMLGSLAERVIEQAVRLLGPELRPALRSVGGFARRNRSSSLTTTMAAFLAANPERRPSMVAAGERTLELYTDFLRECCVAGSHLATWQTRQPRPHAS